MKFKLKNKLEALFGFFSALILSILLFFAVVFSPEYSFFQEYVSNLAYYPGKFFFSVGFTISGVFLVPFFIALERELINTNENIRRLATAISIFTCTCFTLVSIIPDEVYIDLFNYFHAFIAFFSFFGSGVYIFLYSMLMFLSIKSTEYSGPKFHLFLIILGFFTSVGEFILIFYFNPTFEWIIVISIILWIFITSIYLLSQKIIRVPIAELKKLKYSQSLEIFEDMLKKFEKFDLDNNSMTKTIQNNILILKEKLSKQNQL